MMRAILTILTFISIVFFPWPLAAMLVAVSALFVPLVPLAAGIFADTLYYTPQTGLLPLCTFLGALLTGVAFYVRSRLSTGSIIRPRS